jgi:hypothetical protein
MGERLFGVETEYALSGFHADGHRLDGDWVGEQIVKLARTKLVCLPGAQSSGVFLANASRLYVDAGEHIEISTPECTTPWEGVRYTLVGDRILAGLADELVATHAAISAIVLTRCNVDYSGSGATWGCHESYLYRGDPEVVAREIIPHFVSRLVYTGAGGFDNRSGGALFLLSPRVAHLVVERSRSSTSGRGIFHYKDESLAGGDFRRLHVLCGESSCSRLAAWLKLGVTALVVALIEADVRPGRAVRLSSPVDAMRAFAGDPECRVEAPLQDGRMLSAIAIQRHYLEQAEAHLGADFMPPWAAEVCRVWRATLDELAAGPHAVATKLDWAIKLTLFRRHAERRGLAWESLPHWTSVADELADAVTASGFRDASITVEEALRQTRSPVPETVERLTGFLEEHGLSWHGFRPFLDLKKELCEIDTRFSQLGDRGIFQALDRAAVLEHDGPGVGNLDGALETPPASGRARLRGEAIRTLARRRQTSAADWHGVWDRRRKRMLDLRDPFAGRAEWQPWTVDSELEVPWFTPQTTCPERQAPFHRAPGPSDIGQRQG